MLNADYELMREPAGVGIKDLNMSWKEVKAAIIERHKPIAHQFFTAVGSKLQLIDSKIAIAVLKHFAAMNVAVLPVHDSFIMHSGYENELKDVMREALRKEAGISVPVMLTEKKQMTSHKSDLSEEDELLELLSPQPFTRRLDAFYALR